jgi:hypothetical protein
MPNQNKKCSARVKSTGLKCQNPAKFGGRCGIHQKRYKSKQLGGNCGGRKKVQLGG